MRQNVTLQTLVKTDADIIEAKQRGQHAAALTLQRKRDAMAKAVLRGKQNGKKS